MNETSAARQHGERIRALEMAFSHIQARLDHLDECVDGVKNQHRETQAVWEKRWYIGIGLVGGVLIASGLSLWKIVEILGKIRP